MRWRLDIVLAHVSFGRLRALALGAAAALLAAPAAGEFEESHRFDARSLTVTNLIGRVQIGPAAGDEFEVEVAVRGSDGVPRNISIEERPGSRASLDVVFPVDEERRFVYPEFSRRRASLWSPRKGSSSLLGEILGAVSGRRIRVEQRGAGMEVWADLTIRVPAGSTLEVELGAGDVTVSDLEADLEVDVNAGVTELDGLDGDASLGTGSGRLTVQNVRGDLNLDSGSGGVRVDGVEGDSLMIDTGSGSVDVARVRTRSLDVDTGSGGVRLDQVEAGEIVIDTGSGGVRAASLDADSVAIDTGSGSVRLAFSRMGGGNFEVDTGSGGIVLLVPDEASARFDIDTGSGGIDVEVPIARTLHKTRSEIRFVSGEGAARVVLDSGSGSVRVGPSNS